MVGKVLPTIVRHRTLPKQEGNAEGERLLPAEGRLLLPYLRCVGGIISADVELFISLIMVDFGSKEALTLYLED